MRRQTASFHERCARRGASDTPPIWHGRHSSEHPDRTADTSCRLKSKLGLRLADLVRSAQPVEQRPGVLNVQVCTEERHVVGAQGVEREPERALGSGSCLEPGQ